MTENTITDEGNLGDELRKVAAQGYALDAEERIHGVRAVAAPVRDHSGRVVAAISAAGPAFRITGENLQDLMSRVPKLAAQYSRRLGYVPS
jgi:DNA-binding IclR family transcriptional regulator